MGSIRVRKETKKLFIDFRYRGERCREHTALNDTLPNRRKLEKLLQRIEAEIALGTFDYGCYFPNSILSPRFTSNAQTGQPFRVGASPWQRARRPDSQRVCPSASL